MKDQFDMNHGVSGEEAVRILEAQTSPEVRAVPVIISPMPPEDCTVAARLERACGGLWKGPETGEP